MAAPAPPRSPPTLRDVAAAAGVSSMTASRALRPGTECSPETRRTVVAAAARIGYRTNPIVSLYQSLVRQHRSRYRATLGWLNDFPERGHHRKLSYERPIWEGATQRAQALGFRLDEVWIGGTPRFDAGHGLAAARRILRSRGMPGVILPFLCHPELAREDWPEVSVARIGGLAPPDGQVYPVEAFAERYHHAQPDFAANMQLACAKLRERGYRRLGLHLSAWRKHYTGRLYEAAFLASQTDWPAREHVPICDDDPPLHAAEAPGLTRWLKRWRPDAVICTLMPALGWIRAAGYRVPDDIGLVHLWLAEDVAGWSGVDPGLSDLGAAAVDLAVAQIQANEPGAPARPRRLSFLGRWVAGGTTR